MKWLKKDISAEDVQAIRARFGVDALTASILLRRGMEKGEDAMYYLEDDPRYLHSPFLFKDMEDAVDRILAARDEGEKVMVFGDRDADGITGAALLSGALAESGIAAEVRLPAGDDPYGLSMAAVEDFASRDGTLIVTVDNGISCAREVERAGELGVDVIVADHHNPPDEIPRAIAVINPKCEDSGYPFRDLSGCAVAYKLAQAIRFAVSGPYKDEVCLINARPVNEAIAVDASLFSNMAISKRLTEFLMPGAVDLSRTRLIPFLRDKRIVAWDAPLQKRLLAKALGGGVDINLYDAREEIGSAMPQTRGLSLLALREISRMARYRGADDGEMGTFESVFLSFAQRSARAFADADAHDLQLAALGTIADMMSLRGENRIIVKRGLAAMARRPRPGIAELLAELELGGRKSGGRIAARDVSFQLSPVINSAGRMGRPEVALELLTAPDAARRAALVRELKSMNEERKRLGEEAWNGARAEAESSIEAHGGKLALVAGPGLSRGITGIIATRMVKAFKVPAIVCAALADGTVSGSMRSARGLDVRAFLEGIQEVFIDFGGHDYAAGFSMEGPRFPEFRERLALAARAIEFGDDGEETVEIDAELPLDYLKPELIDVAERFEPSGEDSKPATFLTRSLAIAAMDVMGKREPMHLRLTLDSGKNKWPAVYWQAAERAGRDFRIGDRVDVVFTMARDNYSGTDAPRLFVVDAEKTRRGADGR
jgi:single-stranded-DNA-specific exonuclease